MREHTTTPEKTSPRSFTITEEQHRRMREKAEEEGITASALLRRWINRYAAPTGQVAHTSPWGGRPDPSATRGALAPLKRLGKCNPDAKDYAGRPCPMCWPNGAPTALRDGRGNIVSWTLTEDFS